jgi:hypothetical protein
VTSQHIASGSAVRAVAAGQLAASVVMLARPDAVIRAVAGGPGTRRWIVRVLAVRMALQAGLEIAHPTRRLVALGVAIDGTHATSMLLLALTGPRHRRAALASALFASASAAALGFAAWHETPAAGR